MTATTIDRPNTAKISEGVFLIADVAKIIDLPLAKVRHWLIEFWNNRFGENIGGYSFGDNKNRAVNFYTLIEFIAFAKFREEGLSAQKIQRFHASLSNEFKTPYPFTKTKFFTDQRFDVWYEKHHELVKFDGKNQLSSKGILSPFLNKIDFDQNKIALRYYPLGKQHCIVIDPKHQFGQPTILGTNIKAETIYNLIEYGGETIKSIRNLYGLNINQIKDTMQFYRKKAA